MIFLIITFLIFGLIYKIYELIQYNNDIFYFKEQLSYEPCLSTIKLLKLKIDILKKFKRLNLICTAFLLLFLIVSLIFLLL